MPDDPDADAKFVELYDDWAAAWATLEVQEDGFKLAAEWARSAYALGRASALAQLAVA